MSMWLLTRALDEISELRARYSRIMQQDELDRADRENANFVYSCLVELTHKLTNRHEECHGFVSRQDG